jgi:hypothetical protein
MFCAVDNIDNVNILACKIWQFAIFRPGDNANGKQKPIKKQGISMKHIGNQRIKQNAFYANRQCAEM